MRTACCEAGSMNNAENTTPQHAGSGFKAESRRRFPLFELEWVSMAKGKENRFKLTLGPTLRILFVVLLLIVTHHMEFPFLGLVARLLAR